MKLAIFGAGGMGREMLVLAQVINQASARWDAIIFIDDFVSEKYISDVQVHRYKDIELNEFEVVVALGEPAYREKLAIELTPKTTLATLIHPNVMIPHDTKVGAGVVIGAGVFISCNVTLYDNVLIQPGAYISHDCVIKSHSVVCSLVSLGGNTVIGSRSFIGMNSCVRERSIIGDQTIVGMGAVITKDIPNNSLAVGNPARITSVDAERRVFI